MIESLHIQNFRCFKHLELSGLKRFNLMVGPNASGKTALLEAIFLASAASPEIYTRLRSWRGLGEQAVINSTETYDSIWREIFFEMDTGREASIQFVDSDAGKRTLQISYGAREEQLLDLQMDKRERRSTTFTPITFKWSPASGKAFTVIPTPTPMGGMGLRLEGTPELFPSGFMSTSVHDPGQNAQLFSDLSKRKRHQPVIDGVRALYPEVEDLSTELLAGVNVIFASVAGLEEKIPLGLLSSGINRYVEMLLLLSARRHATTVVDEIETGIYFRKLKDVWSGIISACKTSENQLFITTHSKECLTAFLPSLAEIEQDVTLLKFARHGAESGVLTFSGKDLRSAIEQEVEVR